MASRRVVGVADAVRRAACSHPGWRMKGGVCEYGKRRGKKKNIFLTYGANRFSAKMSRLFFDKRFFLALHILRLFLSPFYDITIYTSENCLMRDASERANGFNVAGRQAAQIFV